MLWITWALILEVAVHGLPESTTQSAYDTQSILYNPFETRTCTVDGRRLRVRFILLHGQHCDLQWLSCSLFGAAWSGAAATFAELWHGGH